jgi:single-stranded DNA-binding protein
MSDIDQINFTGRIGKIDRKETKTGKFVHKLSVAMNKYDSLKKEEKTIWKQVEIWNSSYIDKFASVGQKVFVSGETKEEEWTNKDGVKVKNQLCLITRGGKIELFFNGKNNSQGSFKEDKPSNTYSKQQNDVIEDDIPF